MNTLELIELVAVKAGETADFAEKLLCTDSKDAAAQAIFEALTAEDINALKALRGFAKRLDAAFTAADSALK